ncbi:hypothetical protein [Spiroplasma endosymbiont of Lariophagus distinguendus]|uniref:hypothetical protein n=1 Tax=Spiroplasma endosymbiont of Lariophagus distinguendus TaxID=2935082 RepID=UPI00207ADDFE|nr:hypothetical protein [Spiroplasma endosymbiont of Lariophagus distinguendus]
MIKQIKKTKLFIILIILFICFLISTVIIFNFLLNQEKNEKYTQYRIFLNESKKDLNAVTNWGEQMNNSFVYTFEFSETQVIPNNFKYIKFYNKEDLIPDNSIYTWGDDKYRTKSINDVTGNINLLKYLKNVKVGKNKTDNPSDFCNMTICDDYKHYIGSSLKVIIKLGFTYYKENGKWYFQIIITHYGQTWGSNSGGFINTPLGNRFIISKYLFNN